MINSTGILRHCYVKMFIYHIAMWKCLLTIRSLSWQNSSHFMTDKANMQCIVAQNIALETNFHFILIKTFKPYLNFMTAFRKSNCKVAPIFITAISYSHFEGNKVNDHLCSFYDIIFWKNVSSKPNHWLYPVFLYIK